MRGQDLSPTPIDQNATAAEADRVVVTGSHIPTAAEVGPNPVLVIDRDYIDKSGERTAEQFLRELPIANNNGVPISNNATGSAPGASSISLRGFDASATLVLIDGRRIAPYPIGAVDGTQAFIDLNSIPNAAIESIEILKDGASTTYGADAVAGVVNIKFRQDLRGAQSSVEYGNTLDKDNGEFAASLLFGAGDGTTDVSGVVDYYHRNAIFGRDRAFFSNVVSLSSSPGNFEVSRAAVLAAGVPANEIPNQAKFFASPPRLSNGEAPATDYRFDTQRIQRFNSNQFAGAFPESERYGIFTNFDHKVCGDQLVFYGDFFYQHVRTRNELAPTPIRFDTPGEMTIGIPPHAPGETLGGPSYEDANVPLGAFNPFNPFQQIISGGSRYRLADFPQRLLINSTDAFITTAGVKGEKLFDGTWGYDGAFRYSEVKDTAMDTAVSRSRLGRILNAADPIFDPGSAQFIGTTTPYNPFGDFHVPISSNLAGINFASIDIKNLEVSRMATLDFTTYTTSLFKLPAGGVGLAFGGQFRRESIGQSPDDLELHGDVAGMLGSATLTVAGRKSFGIYGETLVPIFSPEMGIVGFHAVDITASARFEDYLNNNTNILVPKIGARWQPFDDSLTLRSTWGEGFREPSLFELHVSPSSFGSDIFDPVTRTPSNETPTLIRSNPNLAPEDSRNFTAGTVYTPKFISGLTLSVDIWDIERHDVVRSPAPQDIVNREKAGRLLPGEEVDRDADGFITRIVGTFINNGGEKARGIDFGLQYVLPTAFGTFTSSSQATYLDSFRLAKSLTAPALEVAGTGDIDAYLKWKGKSRLDWQWKGFDLNATVTYTDGFHEILFIAPIFPDSKLEHWVHQTTFVDVQASYTFTFASAVEAQAVAGYSKAKSEVAPGKDGAPVETSQTVNYSMPCWKNLINGTTITLGCNDVFGQDPPKESLSGFGYPAFLYSPVGRFVYASLKKKF